MFSGFCAHWFWWFPFWIGFSRLWSSSINICFVSNWSMLHLWCFDQAFIKLRHTTGVLLLFNAPILFSASSCADLRLIQRLWQMTIINGEPIHLIISIIPSLNNLIPKPPKVNQYLSICPLSPFNLLPVKFRYTLKIFNLIQDRFFNFIKSLYDISNLWSTQFTDLINLLVQKVLLFIELSFQIK